MADVLLPLADNTSDIYDEMLRDCINHRILIFNEDVNDSLIENYIMYILKWNRDDKNISDISKRQKITIILNSCGGDSVIGFGGMVNCIESSITPIRVVGMGLVASMAFYIYICCKERVSFKDTVFLLHDGEKAAYNSGSKFKNVAAFFDNMDNRTKEHVLKYTNISEDFYDENYEKEVYLYADEAKSLGCVDYIIGEDYTLDDIL